MASLYWFNRMPLCKIELAHYRLPLQAHYGSRYWSVTGPLPQCLLGSGLHLKCKCEIKVPQREIAIESLCDQRGPRVMFLGEVDVRLTQKWKRTEERVKKRDAKNKEVTRMQKIATSEEDIFQDIMLWHRGKPCWNWQRRRCENWSYLFAHKISKC